MSGKLVIFSGPSGAGKSTIVNHLKSIGEFNFGFSVSATTRPKRENENNGSDYHFLSIDDFKSRIEDNEFIEWEEVYPNQYYGTLKSEVNRITLNGKNLLFDVDVVGGTNIKRQYKDNAISVFIQPPSPEVLEARLKSRKTESEENLNKRLKKTRLEMTYARRFDKIIVNDDLETAKREAEAIVRDFLLK
ncbi:MAG: guanylate kinase [Bacteroidales bacterium]|nr:guanylate kinase [Bacteroidales bacterium]